MSPVWWGCAALVAAHAVAAIVFLLVFATPAFGRDRLAKLRRSR